MHRRPVRGNARYALVFDIATEEAGASGLPSENALFEMEAFLARYGFGRRRGSLYFGDDTVDIVRCIMATQDLAETFEWFAVSVRDPQVLRIDAEDDLMPAIARVRPIGAIEDRRKTRLNA